MRIYASNNDPLDFCRSCFPSEAEAEQDYANLGDGPDGRGNCFAHDAEHPDYSCDDYSCTNCGRRLTEVDN